ncbi:heavy-metal-associated domain-containing protein [Sphingomonas sp. RS2018]
MAVRRISGTLKIVLAAAALAGGAALAQIEGGDRGAAPVDSSGDFEVSGIAIDVGGKTAEAARLAGWRLAQRRGWQLLSQRLTGNAGSLPDGALDSLVTGIVVENEQIGPTRYVARLGVLFDRGRAGQVLGVSTAFDRSPPMLVIPVLWSGGAGQAFDRTTPWQQAWARYRTGNSVIDYVRPVGTGADPLLLNVGQTGRRGRGWWRTILDQYGANDVVMPEARLYRSYPGGPVIGVFTAFYGPDRVPLARAVLRVEDSDAIPALLDRGVARLDEAYQTAMRGGRMRTDALLAPPPAPEVSPTPTATATDGITGTEDVLGVTGTAVTIQFDTPAAASITAGEAALRAIPGVRQATTTSLALGGVSVMRVTYDGDPAALRAALEARGWTVQEGGGTLRIRRAAPAPAPAASPTGG